MVINNIKYVLSERNLIIILILIFFGNESGCKQKLVAQNCNAYIKDSVKFPLSATADNNKLIMDYYENGTDEYLFNYNRNQNLIEVYNYNNKQILKKIILPYKIYTFHVHNLDTIFILNKKKNEVGIINAEGFYKDSINLEYYLNDSIKYETIGTNTLRLYYNDPFVFFRIGASVNPQDFYHYPIVAQLNIKNHELNKMIYFTDKYRINQYFKFMPYFCLQNENTIVSYEIEDNIAVFKDHNIRNYNAKSKFLEIELFDEEKSNNKSYYSTFEIESPSYGAIIYDKYQKLFYRFAFHKLNLLNPDGSRNNYHDRKWSIIILDQDYKYLKEVIFPEKQFNFNDFIVTKDGLLVSYNHTENPKYDNNSLSFILFNFK